MIDNSRKEIYFHVGTGKTGSTFLQARVFPKYQGIHYFPTNRYRKIKQLILKTDSKKILVSREFDQQLEVEVKKFAASFPQAVPIIVFRKQDSYIASQYRRFVKNGFKGKFQDFIDLKEDKGRFNIQDLDYTRMVIILEQTFEATPIVLLYDDLRKNPQEFVSNLAEYMNCTVDLNSIDFSKKHSSYSEKQLKVISSLGKYFDLRKRRIFNNGLLHFLWRLFLGFFRYSILFLAKFVPESWLSSEPLIRPEELEEVRVLCEQDWEKTKQRAGVNIASRQMRSTHN